jgi:uncharacterized protein YjiS (DUF1127 family)
MQHPMHQNSTAFAADIALKPAITARTNLAPTSRSFANALSDIWLVLEKWASRRRQRYALMQLDEHLLKDIGLTRGVAASEYGKPFWRP